jgi:probable phosphoglycerate mutase
MTRILIVRHGQSEWNALGRWQGQADPPLSELGRQQAFSAARRLGTVDAIVSSDLERAMHTAQIISGQLGVGPVAVEPQLRERDAGEWSGLTREDIDERYPGYLEQHLRPASVETDESLLTRTHEALDRIHATYTGAEVIVIAHGGVVYALEKEHELPFERLPNLGARWVTHHGDRISLGERVILVDDEDITTVPAQI